MQETKYPNLLQVASYIAHQSRKIRKPICLKTESIEKIITIMTNNITKIMLKYNSKFLYKIINNDTRKREFVCSMLYLSRVGVHMNGEVILPKIEILRLVLPNECFLTSVFKIRAKAITEGENLLKIELREFKKKQHK